MNCDKKIKKLKKTISISLLQLCGCGSFPLQFSGCGNISMTCIFVVVLCAAVPRLWLRFCTCILVVVLCCIVLVFALHCCGCSSFALLWLWLLCCCVVVFRLLYMQSDCGCFVVYCLCGCFAVVWLWLLCCRCSNKHVKYTDEPGVEKCGFLVVEMPDPTGGRERAVDLEVVFGGTEIKVVGYDHTSKTRRETYVDFLSQ